MTEPKKKCGECKFFVQSEYLDVCTVDCETRRDDTELNCEFFQEKIKTNRDVINALTDEDLAKWKESCPVELDDKNGYCRIFWQNPQRCRPELKCKDCLTAWLKAPAGKHQEV